MPVLGPVFFISAIFSCMKSKGYLSAKTMKMHQYDLIHLILDVNPISLPIVGGVLRGVAVICQQFRV